MILDTTRILLGRNAFDPASGTRHIRASTVDDNFWGASAKSHNVFNNNLGDIPVSPPYELQVWKLAGKDPATRPNPELAEQDSKPARIDHKRIANADDALAAKRLEGSLEHEPIVSPEEYRQTKRESVHAIKRRSLSGNLLGTAKEVAPRSAPSLPNEHHV